MGWCVDGDGDGCGCVKFTVGELVGLALREVDGGLSCGGHVGGWRGEGEGGGSQPPTTNRSMRHNDEHAITLRHSERMNETIPPAG